MGNKTSAPLWAAKIFLRSWMVRMTRNCSSVRNRTMKFRVASERGRNRSKAVAAGVASCCCYGCSGASFFSVSIIITGDNERTTAQAQQQYIVLRWPLVGSFLTSSAFLRRIVRVENQANKQQKSQIVAWTSVDRLMWLA